MADDWFDGGSPPHLAANGFGDALNLAADPDAELLFVIVAAITLVDMDAAGLNAGLLLPCKALACSTNWPPLGLVAGVAIDTLQPNSYGARAFPLPMHSTSGACSA